MEGAPDTLRAEAIAAFRNSLVEDVFAPRDFIPWGDINEEVKEAAPGVELLNQLAESGENGIDAEALAEAFLAEPKTFSVVQRLLAAPAAGVGFADGRQLPESVPRDPRQARQVARLLIDVGINRLITEKAATEELLRVAIIAGDTRRRSGRRRRSLDERLSVLLEEAASEATETLGEKVVAREPTGMPPGLRNRLQRVLCSEDGRPLVAVATMFEAIGGGRQGATFRGFVQVQDELDLVPASLVLVADGRGVREIPLRSVEEVWERVGCLLSLKQAEEGMLAEAVVRLIKDPAVPSLERMPLETLIGSALDRQVRVEAEELPVDEGVARLAIARFEADNEKLGLDIDADGRSVVYRRAEEVADADKLNDEFDSGLAIDLVARLVGRRFPVAQEELPDGQWIAVLDVPTSPLLPGVLAVAAQPTDPTAQEVRVVAEAARARAVDTTVAILVVPDASEWLYDEEREIVTRTTTTSVVVVDPHDIRAIAAAAEPQDELSALILRQADLTKASPFIHNGVTPPRLFTGRRGEGADLVSALGSSSVAVLGSRQIGKTSFLRWVFQTLEAQDRSVYYGDCQAVGDWERFRALARRDWGVRLEERFEPDQIAALVEELTTDKGPPVIILDEIDPLVAWDRATEVGGVTEAFFRSLRAQSQAGQAQFVFSGERTIAEVFWSPSSPHWNFCQRLSLRQLNREDASQLLFKVLASLAVRFEDRDAGEEILWQATSGHPRLVQLLGDQLVRRLNERPGDERDLLTPADLRAVVDTFDFKSEYVDTYWGQATPFEQHLTRLVAEGDDSLERLQELMAEEDEPLALKVLELYGIIDVVGETVRLRAAFLPEALVAAGPEPSPA